MTRTSAAATLRLRAWRWLLVVSVLTGMGLWQGAHCADPMLADGASASVATAEVHSAQSIDAGPESTMTPHVAASHQIAPGAPVVENCHSPLVGAVSAVGAASVAPSSNGVCVPRIQWRPGALAPNPLAAVSLTQLGISRT